MIKCLGNGLNRLSHFLIVVVNDSLAEDVLTILAWLELYDNFLIDRKSCLVFGQLIRGSAPSSKLSIDSLLAAYQNPRLKVFPWLLDSMGLMREYQGTSCLREQQTFSRHFSLSS